MFNDLDNTLVQLVNDAPVPELQELHDADVSFMTPDRNFAPGQATVNLFLYEVRENRELRDPTPIVERNGARFTRRAGPLRADCSYIVTTWAAGSAGPARVAAEHQLLGQALTWLSRFPTIPEEYRQGALGDPDLIYPPPTMVAQLDPNQHAGDFWTAMGVAPRPAFYLTVTVELDLGVEVTGPLVTTRSTDFISCGELDGRWIGIGGRVVDQAAGEGVGGAVIDLLDLDIRTRSLAEGRYSFPRVPAGPHTVRVDRARVRAQDPAIRGPRPVGGLRRRTDPVAVGAVRERTVTMCAFQIRDKAPGVYIDEIDVPGPIAGVATAVAAFVGPALNGPIGEPRLVTNWTEFNTIFGDPDPLVGPYVVTPRSYAANAVEGYFANGGSRCYFVRVGTAVRAWRAFQDVAGNDTLRVTAKRHGDDGNQIRVEIRQAPSIATTKVVSETAPTTGTVQPPAGGVVNQIRLAQADDSSKFLVGDRVAVSDNNGTEEGQIADIDGDTLTLDRVLTRQFAQGDVRHADLTAAQTRLRVASPSGIDPGSNLEFTQAGGPPPVIRTVNRVEGGTGFIELAAGLGSPYDLTAGDVDVASREFGLVINGGAETFEPLSRDPRHSRYFASAVISQVVDVSPIATQSQPPDDSPAAAAEDLEHGANDNLFAIGAAEFEAGIDALRTVDQVTIVCVPDNTGETVQTKMINHCEEMQDRFAVLDARPGLDRDAVIDQLRGTPGLNSDKGFGALYYPWIQIRDPKGSNGARLTIPPSGHIAGLYARVDDDRGVFKAPANEGLRERARPRAPAHGNGARAAQRAERQRASARCPAAAWSCGGRVRSRRPRGPSGATSTCGGSCCSSRSRSRRAPSSPSSSRTSPRCGRRSSGRSPASSRRSGPPARSSARRRRTPSACESTRSSTRLPCGASVSSWSR